MGLGIVNGVAFYLGEAFSDPNLVLSVFVSQLGASAGVVGLLPALRNGGWLLPQMLNAGRVQAMTYKLPSYRRAGVVRWWIWLLLVAVVWFADRMPAALALGLFLACYAGYNLVAGMGALAFQDVVAKTIPAERRGTFFGARNFLGGLLAFLIAGPTVATVLARTSPFVFPSNYGLLVLITLLVITPGLLSFFMMEEPPTENPPAAMGARHMIAAAPGLLRRDAAFRRFVGSRIVTRLASLADPFYILFAGQVLDVPPRMIGVYLAVRVITAALSNVMWARVADKHGNRRLLLITGVLITLVPFAALAMLPLQGVLSPEALGWAFGGVFLLMGLSADGAGTANMTYLMELAPEGERPAYIAVANTMLGLATLFPVLGGLLLGLVGYPALFVVTALLGAWGVAMTFGLCEPRTLAVSAA